MAPEPFAALHGGYGLEITLLEYFSRVLLHLLAFGGIAVFVLWGSGAVEVARSTFVAERDDENRDETNDEQEDESR